MLPGEEESWQLWCQEQGLDEECFNKLMELDPEQREVVRTGFKPKSDTHNVSGLFVSYVRSIALKGKGKGGGKGSDKAGTPANQPAASHQLAEQAHDESIQDEVAQFALTWELDEECAEQLLQQSEQVIRDVLAGFSPKPGTVNVRKLFFGYLNSVVNGTKGGGKKGVKGGHFGMEDEVVEFANAWGLGDDCVQELLAQRPQVIRDVLTGFQPKPGTWDVRSLFFGYLNSVVGAGKGGKGTVFSSGFRQSAARTGGLPQWLLDDVYRFAETHQLDDDCIQQLTRERQEVVQDVLHGFAPKPGTRDARSLFVGYLRSVVNGSKGGGFGGSSSSKGATGGKGKGQRGVASVFFAPSSPQKGGKPARSYAAPVNKSFARLQEEISNFAAYWELDEECVQMLMEQNPEVVNDVLEGFSPKPGTMNVRSLFVSYLRSVAGDGKGFGGKASESSYGKGRYAAPAQERRGPYSRPVVPIGQGQSWSAGDGYSSRGSPRASGASDEEIRNFGQHWRLDDKCLEFLASQDPHVQREALANFHPKGFTANPNGLFMGYLSSLMKGMKGGGKGKK